MAGLLAGTANAAPWATIARNVESVVEIDSGSLTRKGQSVRAWSRQVYSEDQPLPLGDPPFRAVRYFYAYECGKRTALLVRRTYVDEQGQPIKDQILDGLEMARDVIPGTLQERVYEYACKASKDAEKVAAVATTKTDAASVDGKVVSKKGKNGIKKEDQQAEERLGKEADAEEGNRENAEDVSEKEAKGKEKKAIGEQTSEATLKEEKGHGKSSVKPAKASQRKSTKPKDEDDAEHGKAGQGESEDQEERAEEDHGKGHGKPDKVVMLEKAKKGKHDLDDKCVGCNRADDEEKADQKPEKGDGHAHWDYEGKNGPQNWAKLSPEFATCGSGKFQSPIDIKEGIKLSLEPIKFDWKPSALKILDNGHTVQVNYGSGSSITVNGERYELVQFHFHKPSEERIDGKAFDMVAHFVHKNGSGSLAVVAAMLRNGAPNPLIQTLWTHLPLQPGKENSPKDVKIDANQLLPADRAYYTFLGSLTTPPCTEGVLWLVMKNPLQVSRSQIAAFGRLYETNARPIQPSNRRLIKESL